jgi:hypothetical protein
VQSRFKIKLRAALNEPNASFQRGNRCNQQRGRCVTRYSFLILLFNLLVTVRKCLMDEICLDRVRYKVFLAKRHSCDRFVTANGSSNIPRKDGK